MTPANRQHRGQPKAQYRGLRPAIAWAGAALAYVIALSFFKGALIDELAAQAQQRLKTSHAKTVNLFQASYYFFYEDQFIPGIRETLGESGFPPLERIVIVATGSSESNGAVLFDSSRPRKPADAPPAGAPGQERVRERELLDRLAAPDPSVLVQGYRIQVVMPGSQYGVLYSFDASSARNRVALAFALGMLAAAAVHWVLSRRLTTRIAAGMASGWGRLWKLRPKFLLTIALIDLLTALLVFTSLVRLQSREQSERIQRDSLLFSQFSTSQVISNFTNFFYFYYSDRFIPEIKRIIASNENLIGMRIVSRRTRQVLFDSEQSPSEPQAALADLAKAEFTPDIEEQLKTRDLATQYVDRGGERMLLVVNTYRNESQDAVFWVEYLFSFQSLARSIVAIREQILQDLALSLGVGLLVAAVFAQLLISPIRRLMGALGKVTAGDYDVVVDLKRGDEIGDLVTAFNSMTAELRKKKELRKYLSDSTYRQIMKAPDSRDGGGRIGGQRVSATILFSDIRNFVGHCENLEAEEVTAMLNEYFSEMVEVVHKHGGEVDKFIGDALLAVFYASDDVRSIRPGEGADAAAPTPSATALQAIYCALEMREKLAEFNARRVAAQKSVIEIGVGITHGEIISGPIGSKDRMDFTVIGDVVNLANRIEKLTKKGKHTKIVFSNAVEELVRGLLSYEEMQGEKVRGKEELVRIYELVGVRDIEFLVANLATRDLVLRRRSVELLGQSRNEAALPHVIRALDDEDELTRLQAVLAVSKLASSSNGAAGPGGAPEGDGGDGSLPAAAWRRSDPTGRDSQAFDALLAHLGTEQSDKVLSALISAVGKLSDESRIDRTLGALRPFLPSTNERIVANAIEALGQARNSRCTDLILPHLASRNNRVKANAAMAMFAAGHIEVIDMLKPMLMHSDPLMRSSAAFALGELTVIAEQEQLLGHWKPRTQAFKHFLAELQECVPMLVTLLRDSEPMVRRQAIVALGKIRDKSAVLPMIEMLDPAKGTRELLGDISQALRSIGSHKLVREMISKLSVKE